MDIRKVKKLIEMLEESRISEIEIHEGEESVRISRHGSVPANTETVQVPVGDGQELVKSATSPQGRSVPATGDEPEMEGHLIRSPMVGIFYAAPTPDKPPFTEVGKAIKKGDILCIIEAMKIMNQIESDTSGTVSRVFVENGEPVEYGQPLFLIRQP